MAGLPHQLVLDDGRLVVAHAGLREDLHGVDSGRARSFALYGDTTGRTDEYGLPVRLPWQDDYRGDAMVVYGHTPVIEAEWVNNTHLPRHRRGLRRPADRAALPRARAGRRTRRAAVVRPPAAAPVP